MAEQRTLTHLDRTLRLVAPHELIEVASAQACALGDGAQHRVLRASPGTDVGEPQTVQLSASRSKRLQQMGDCMWDGCSRDHW
jgi:hypothetical protein